MSDLTSTHTRKRLTEELAAADKAWDEAIGAAVGRYGDWRDGQQAGEVVRQCRAALKAAGADDE